jgi:hypothetical protein
MKMMKMVFVTLFVLMSVSAVQASTIVVGGQEIEIPSNYRQSVTQDRANRCWAEKLTKVQTEEAAKNLPLACTELVLQYGSNWEKH